MGKYCLIVFSFSMHRGHAKSKDENSLRWVMWWQRSGTAPEAVPVFHATQVSREILMFQLTVVEVVIGDVPKTLQVGLVSRFCCNLSS